MKEFSKSPDADIEFDFESFADEMDILFGTHFGARSMVNRHIDTNIVDYSDTSNTPLLLESTDEVQELIGSLLPYKRSGSDSRFTQ